MPESETSAEGTLTAAEFATFFRAVHGVDPFAWQQELATQVLADGLWPDLVDVPTGLGKTALLDIGVFVMAATAHRDPTERAGRRRLFFVVDRRLVVDEAYGHAQRLSTVLNRPTDSHAGVLGRVAAAVRSLAPTATGELLPVTRMRGGTTWAAAWLDRPDRPGIVLGTVDQVGSRLLFRGYGVSDRRRPLDAALVGTDSLVVLDEAHLSGALLTTVGAARARDRLGVPVPGLALVRMSATADPTAASYRLDADAHRHDATAWQRLTAGKRLTIHETTAKACAKELARLTAEQLGALTAAGAAAPAALVVCNTVDRAREVHTRLRTALPGADCELLIGRSRPIDRPGLHRRVLDLLGSSRSPAERPAVLIATQTVEVGVNLDADLLVTESASWDALVQRLGRLNRLGHHPERCPGSAAATAVVVHDGQADGPVYGAARDATSTALSTLAAQEPDGIDVSPLACRRLSATIFAEPDCARTAGDVPILLGPILDAWTQTGPVPLNDPPVAPYLHGIDGGSAPVQVVWRDGLLVEGNPLDDPFGDGDIERSAAQADALLTQSPPRTAETVEVPFIAVRRWLAGTATGPVADVDLTDDEAPRTSAPVDPFRVLAQRPVVHRGRVGDPADAPVSWQWIDERQLRPGDLVVVPTRRGALDRYGWAPDDPAPVTDVSEAASFTATRSRRPVALRLDTWLASRLGVDDQGVADALLALTAADDDEPTGSADIAAAADLLAAHLPATPPANGGWTDHTWAMLRAWLTGSRLQAVEIHDPTAVSVGELASPLTWLLAGPMPSADTGAPAPAVAEGDDDEVAASSVAGGPVTLADHHTAVRRRAEEIADALRLPADLRAVVADAAGWHDLGKTEERFQVMLHNGDPATAAQAAEPLAKSGLDPTDRLSWRRARRLSRLPSGARHEAWSAALVEEHLASRDVPYPGDTELLLHLVASHHGHSRPLALLVSDQDPRPVRALVDAHKVEIPSDRTVSLEHPHRFARLNQRYGRWGLALLESLVRCADTTVSGEGS